MTTDLIPIRNTQNPDLKADIIFVHGLGGDARGTWHPLDKKDDNNFWPVWLGEDFKDFGIWSINYEVEPVKWKGSTMYLNDRATNIVDLLDVKKLGNRPIIFITHSMGGLVVKQMLLNGTYSEQESWGKIVDQTKGIVFLSTPHSGSNIADWFKYIGGVLGASVSVKELEADNPQLINLNAQYCGHEKLNKIPVLVYFETKEMKIVGNIKAIVVNRESANPGDDINDIKIVGLDEDHISISKPNAKNHRIYQGVKQFIEKCLSDVKAIAKIGSLSFAEQVKKENLEADLKARKKDYEAVSKTHRRENNPAVKNNLKAQMDELFEEIQGIELELKNID